MSEHIQFTGPTADDEGFIQSQLKREVVSNVINKDILEDRIKKVFDATFDSLVLSYGPGGAGAFLSRYPEYYSSKDGFNIGKYIFFENKLDQVIYGMISAISSKSNFDVGDGTTTAVIVTKYMYDAYMEAKEDLQELNILPRDILKTFEKIKDDLIEDLKKCAREIRSDDPDVLYKNIYDVALISSNGDTNISEMIATLYKELMYPAITTTMSSDGLMAYDIVEGYKIDLVLSSEKYINNDNDTMTLDSADVIVFDHKVTRKTYDYILKPLNEECRKRGRHLICAAPFYDEKTLDSIIQADLNNEYRRTNDMNLVLTVCPNPTGSRKVRMADLAMLLHTSFVTSDLEDMIIERVKNEGYLGYVINIDDRGIPGVTIMSNTGEKTDGGKYYFSYTSSTITEPALKTMTEEQFQQHIEKVSENDLTNTITLPEGFIRPLLHLGYAGHVDLGKEESVFQGFYYDEKEYQLVKETARKELEEIRKKCETVGVYSPVLGERERRYYSLSLKMGVIYIGADSELSQSYIKDFIDDTIKATRSAYYNGVVKGCGVTLLDCIAKRYKTAENELEAKLLRILRRAYKRTYKSIIDNVIPKTELTYKSSDDNVSNVKVAFGKYGLHPSIDDKIMREVISDLPYHYTLSDIIVGYSQEIGKVFDLSKGEFTDDIINSVRTDESILVAVTNLLGLLITSNQLVLC